MGILSLSLKQARKKELSAAFDSFRVKNAEYLSFEDMVTRFISQSNDKMSDLKQRGEHPKCCRKP